MDINVCGDLFLVGCYRHNNAIVFFNVCGGQVYQVCQHLVFASTHVKYVMIGCVVAVGAGGAFVVDRIVLVAVLKDIVLIPVHTKPWDSEKELDELYDVFLVVKDKWKTDVSRIGVTPESSTLKVQFERFNGIASPSVNPLPL